MEFFFPAETDYLGSVHYLSVGAGKLELVNRKLHTPSSADKIYIPLLFNGHKLPTPFRNPHTRLLKPTGYLLIWNIASLWTSKGWQIFSAMESEHSSTPPGSHK